MAGRLLMGWLADRFPKKYGMLLIYLLVAGAMPFLFTSRLPLRMYVFAILFGVGLGGDYMIIPLLSAELFDVHLLGRVWGVILTADGVAEAVAPWIAGHLRNRTSSYSTAFLFLMGISLLGSAAVWLLPKRAVRA
jgi:MFS family permease